MSMVGKTLGNFTLEAQIGKGGMGEVYKAKDQKLGRDVAIKVLPEEFAKDTDRVARFQREAKLLASLNHPNIAAIHGLEESDGIHFLVLELIEGDMLADRLKRGAVPVEESLKLALQIAEALEAAHEKGVIHRDLKPANIKVTPDGKVKVLDFGLAKAFAGEQAEVNLSHSPTLSEAATLQGVILGTAAYMSPEQARGKPVDKRTDIWAFGCVLYEMLTGKAAFQGEDVTEILAAVVKSGVNLDLLPANIHPRIREVIIRCLQKEQKKRYGGIGEAQYEIEQVLADPSGVFAQPITTVKSRKKMRVGIPWVTVIAILCLIVAGVAVWKFKPTEPKRVMRFTYDLPEGQRFNNDSAKPGHTLAVSPDGTQFIYSTSEGLYIRFENELEARLITGTDDNPQSPFFSPDGQWVGYGSLADNQLKKIAISGGVSVALCHVNTFVYGAIWYADNTIVYADVGSGIMRVSANGGTPETLVRGFCVTAQLLPDGKSVIFSDAAGEPDRIVVQSLESGERKELFRGDVVRYLPTGHLVYSVTSNANLFAIPFDLDTLEVTGGPVPIIEGVGLYAISDSGTLVYIPQTTSASESAAPSQNTLVWVDREGNEEPLGASPNAYQFPRISPDGTQVALSINTGGNEDIWIWDLFRKTSTRLTFHDARDDAPLWTPDGKRIVFESNRSGSANVHWKAADGTGEVEQLGSLSAVRITPSSWSSDGKTLVLEEVSADVQSANISAMSMEGDHTKNLLLEEIFVEANPQVSPDGRWLAYMSNESGQDEVYVRPFPDVSSGQWQVSTSGGMEPRWSPDGQQLFYRDPSGNAMMAVDIETEPTFKAGISKALFQGTYFSYIGHNWDISPDGERFLMIKPPETTKEESSEEESAAEEPQRIIVVTNWFEELKQKVPVD